MNILVLHGPNLNLLGERPGDDPSLTLAALDRQLRARAAQLGQKLKIVWSNHEGVLVDALHAERGWADALLVSPAELAHTSFVLREAIVGVGKPAIEVHLTDIRRRESWRRKSVLKDVCASQVMGKGFDSYLLALERLAAGDLAGKKRRAVRAPKKKAPAAARAGTPKTLGRKAEPPTLRVPAVSRTPASDFLTRALVREKISERLAGRITAGSLSTWARGRWLDVQRGAPAESGHRELLEESLQQLVLASVHPARLTDEQLIELMAQLDG
jgi:3-dehydroquinate dehydratase II